jgi:hypothetical protein
MRRVLLPLVLAACVVAQDSREAERRAAAQRVHDLLPRVAALRGLPPPPHLDVVVLRPDDVAARADAESAPEDVAFADDEARLFRALRLLPPDTTSPGSAHADDRDFRTGQIAGFYDHERRALALVPEAPAPFDLATANPFSPAFDPLGLWLRALGPPFVDDVESTLVHELGHALQHARAPALFGDDAAASTDLDLAVMSLLEGDAVFLEWAWAARRRGVPLERAYERGVFDALLATFDPRTSFLPEDLAATPRWYRDRFAAPYYEGLRFCRAVAAARGGFAGLTAALDRPPLSTEQILHPRKYLDPTPDVPTDLEPPDVSRELGPGVFAVMDDALGELAWRTLLEGPEDPAPDDAAVARHRRRAAYVAAEGWDGDRCVLYELPGGADALTATSTWDSEDDAEEFAAALAARIERELGPAATRPADAAQAPAGAVYRRARGGRVETVVRRGVDVDWIRDVPRKAERAVLRALAEETRRAPRTKLR